MNKVILPPEIEPICGQLIFLAGPIQGAYLWQDEAIKILTQLSPLVIIANPRRPIFSKKEFSQKDYEIQVDWETYYLRLAANQGVILFWLAKEYEHFCERAYAQTSRFELGEWKMNHQYHGTKLAIGIEPGFTNENYLRRRLGQDCPEIPIFTTLQDTCEQAIKLLNIS